VVRREKSQFQIYSLLLLDSLFEPEQLKQASFRQEFGFLEQPAKATHPKAKQPKRANSTLTPPSE